MVEVAGGSGVLGQQRWRELVDKFNELAERVRLDDEAGDIAGGHPDPGLGVPVGLHVIVAAHGLNVRLPCGISR